MAEEEKKAQEEAEEEFLLPKDTLLSAGLHIGSRMKTKDMAPFIYKARPDGLFVLDLKKTDERIRIAAKFLSRFEPSKIVVASTKLYGREPVRKFCEVVGATPVVGRFIPGSFTNPLLPTHMEAEVLLVTDPRADGQAVEEATKIGVPVVAFCGTDNSLRNVDLAIPVNNKGRRALAVAFWLLARQILRERGEIPEDGDIPYTPEDFETKVEEE